MENKEMIEACADLSDRLIDDIKFYIDDLEDASSEEQFQITLNALTNLTAKLIVSCAGADRRAELLKEISESLESKCAAWSKIKEEQNAKN